MFSARLALSQAFGLGSPLLLQNASRPPRASPLLERLIHGITNLLDKLLPLLEIRPLLGTGSRLRCAAHFTGFAKREIVKRASDTRPRLLNVLRTIKADVSVNRLLRMLTSTGIAQNRKLLVRTAFQVLTLRFS